MIYLCETDKTYMIPYKGIKIPIRLEQYGSVGKHGNLTHNMFIGKKFIGRHWCVHCASSGNWWSIYNTCERCIASEQHKITRSLNANRYGASKLRGEVLEQVFKEEYHI